MIILAAASACFARKGYHRTTMDEIVIESGLSKGTLYWYYKSKQDLFIAMFESWAEVTMGGMMSLAHDATQSAADRIRALMTWSMEAFEDEPEIVTLMMEAFTTLRGNINVYEQLTKVYTPFMDLLADIIEDGVHRGEFHPVKARPLAEALGAALDGIAIQALIEIPGNTRERVTILIDVVIDGLTRMDTDV